LIKIVCARDFRGDLDYICGADSKRYLFILTLCNELYERQPLHFPMTSQVSSHVMFVGYAK